MEMKKIPGTQLIQRVALILNTFNDIDRKLSLMQIVKKTGLHPATTFRILNALTVEGFIYHNGQTGEYSLGVNFIRLGELARLNFTLSKIAYKHTIDFAKIWGETTNIDVLNSSMQVTTILNIPSTYHVSNSVPIGTTLPPHCTSTGKVILAYMNEDEVDRIFESGLSAKTSKTITDLATLKAQLKKIRDQGFSLNIGELEVDLNAVGAPIRDVTGKVIAALSVGGPSTRVNEKTLLEMSKIAVIFADKISEDMGYIKPT